jgi:hypothetical protein
MEQELLLDDEERTLIGAVNRKEFVGMERSLTSRFRDLG